MQIIIYDCVLKEMLGYMSGDHIKFLHTCSAIFVWYSPKHGVLQSATLQADHMKLVAFPCICAEQTLHFLDAALFFFFTSLNMNHFMFFESTL
jgi:hypothetical protein